MRSQLRLLRILQALVFVGALALGVTPAFAADIGNDGVFQIDGDVRTSNGNGDDWDTLFTFPGPTNGPANPSARSYVTDPAPASIFTGGGSKDQLDISQWQWKNGSVPDKDDVTNSFAAVYSVGSQRLYFGADRLANNGDAQIGFWFFQNVVKLGANGTFVDQNGNPATHKVGDVLVLSNFVQGGSQSNIQVFEVTAVNPDGSVSLLLLESGATGDARVCTPDGNACAATNGTDTPSLDPAYTPKFGTQGTYPIVSFFEGGLDLTALGLGGECFPNFLVETRSSQSITAVLKDFTLKELQQCNAAISTQILDKDGNDVTGTTVPANTTIHDAALVAGTAGFPTPTGTVTFNRFTNDSCSGTPAATEDATLDSNGTAVSSDFTPLPGSLSYNASYGGDNIYPATGPSACEPLTVSKFSSAVNTRILVGPDFTGEVTNQAINLAGAASVLVKDEAAVTGAGPTPTGTVTFSLFDNGNCSGNVTTETVALDANGKALSSQFSLGPDTLSYSVIYNGDSNYTPSGVSKCEPACAFTFTTSQP